MVQQVTGDYPAAAASLQQSLKLCHALGYRLGQAEALNGLGELSSRTSASRRALHQHTEALAIARDLGVPLEEARALEGIGRSHLQDGDRGQAAAHLRQALTIYQRIGAPCARRSRKPSATTNSITVTTSTAMTKPARRRDDAGPGQRESPCVPPSSEQLGDRSA